MEQQIDTFERQQQSQYYQDYGSEGYHPVYLGQKFNNNTYTVLQKLGWGHFSTVWLVIKEQTQQHFALKIQRSKKQHKQSAIDQLKMLAQIKKHQQDIEWLQLVSEYQTKSPQKTNIQLCKPLQLVDNFVHSGMNGQHMCSVFELMGPNLLDLIHHYKNHHQRMPLWLVKKITRELLLGLVYLHQRCDIIHTDLKPENIMIKFEKQEEQQLIQQLKEYKVKPLSMKYLSNKQLQQNQEPTNTDNQKEGLENNQLEQWQSEQQNQQQKEQQKEQENEQQNEQQKEEENEQEKEEEKEEEKEQEKEQEQEQLTDQKWQSQISSVKQDNAQFQSVTSYYSVNSDQNSNKLDPLENATQPKTTTLQPVSKKELILQIPQKDEQFLQAQNAIDLSQMVWKGARIKVSQKCFFKIVDLGNSCFSNHHYTEDIQTREYRSPEVILGHPYYHNTDVFSLACVVFQMMTGDFLFSPKKYKNITKDEDQLYRMIKTLGPMDKQFCLTGKHSSQYFRKCGKLKAGNPTDSLTIHRMLVQIFKYPPQIARAAEEFLLPMLAYDPKDRAQARVCLQSEWLWT